jgi:hypothetical protein
MTRATIWAICLIIGGIILLIFGLVHVLSGKDVKEGEFNKRADRAMVMMFLGGALSAFGTVIGIIQIVRHFLR